MKILGTLIIFLFAGYILSAAFLFGPGVASHEYHKYFGKNYPNNHVFQAILAINAGVNTGKIKTTWGGNCIAADVTDAVRGTLSAESFSQIVPEFDELGMTQPQFTPMPGHDYFFGLSHKDISKFKIPNSIFDPPLASENLGTVFDVSIKFKSEKHYEITKSTIRICQDML